MAYIYEDKKIIADAYLKQKAGVTWDELDDINSLHDVESREDIEEACDERLKESGFPTDDDE